MRTPCVVAWWRRRTIVAVTVTLLAQRVRRLGLAVRRRRRTIVAVTVTLLAQRVRRLGLAVRRRRRTIVAVTV
ncbi:MAG: hypothetical protein ACHQT7_01800, partial [Candidatus Levyibacteriota bacterium]